MSDIPLGLLRKPRAGYSRINDEPSSPSSATMRAAIASASTARSRNNSNNNTNTRVNSSTNKGKGKNRRLYTDEDEEEEAHLLGEQDDDDGFQEPAIPPPSVSVKPVSSFCLF